MVEIFQCLEQPKQQSLQTIPHHRMKKSFKMLPLCIAICTINPHARTERKIGKSPPIINAFLSVKLNTKKISYFILQFNKFLEIYKYNLSLVI